MKKLRADELIVMQGLADSRTKAQAMILSKQVKISKDDVITKPSKMLSDDTEFIIKNLPKFVSRGGEKLEKFILQFSIDVSQKSALDVGASTGGFTDCLLQYGVNNVVCIDVGLGQLHYKLKKDKRVVSLEKINARNVLPSNLPQSDFDIIVIDVSFISLKKILPNIWQFLRTNGILIALVKPQFEAEKEEIDKCCGVIKDQNIKERIINDVEHFCLSELPLSEIFGKMESPILGGDGNKEFLLGLIKTDAEKS